MTALVPINQARLWCMALTHKGDFMSFQEVWDELIDKRNNKLNDSDWTQMPDSPLSDVKKQEWAVYRQLLRDITKNWDEDVDKNTVNPGDSGVANIWPTKPLK